MTGRHTRVAPISDAVPLVVAALLVGAGGAALVFAAGAADLRTVAALVALAAVIPVLLLARSDRRVERTLARRDESLRRSVASLAESVGRQRADPGPGARFGAELDRLSLEVGRLRDQLARPGAAPPAYPAYPPYAPPYPPYPAYPLAYPAPPPAYAAPPAAAPAPAPVVVQLPAQAPVVVERPEPVYLERTTSTVDLPLLREALRAPAAGAEPPAAALRLVDLTAYDQRATQG